jgi:hypothetical protein
MERIVSIGDYQSNRTLDLRSRLSKARTTHAAALDDPALVMRCASVLKMARWCHAPHCPVTCVHDSSCAVVLAPVNLEKAESTLL